ncbi:putative FtsX-related transmembrane transport protein [Fulvivirga imtechensis AK7]|uniref:Putative FtsX-related transmembrane transport protein n=1 Tax=Fulvivirga imtechensis AK7 TaxID=1237149 RepID=L8JXY1_9BACT|nr:ABC transporter permease [Fulvivirga imtechensis]ELR72499.1 putative FtsX-related transmembrane transport protein [Fulvivirga imtechensis AK7]
MLRNYIKVAIRNILKHRVFSFINIFGLAVGMSVCMLIIMLVANQMMNDRHNPGRERIYRVNSLPYYNGNQQQRGNENATTSLPICDELLNNYTGVEKAVRLVRGFGNNWISLEPGNDINIPVSGYYADPEVLDMFALELQYGDPATALVEPYSVVLTRKTAAKLFKEENPVGESLKVGDLGTYKVTGVIKETDDKSHIVVEAYASMSTMKSLQAAGVLGNQSNDWYNFYTGWVYIMLEEGKKAADIEPHLAKIHDEHFAELPTPETTAATYRLQPLMSITPGPLVNNPIGPFMPWIIIYFLSGLAAIILITSCFNFTNLSIARSMSRAREIGVRKVTGAKKIQIFNQFISESVIISLFALVLASLLLVLLKPFLLELAFAKVMHWNMTANAFVYAVFFAFAVVVGIMAGLFPATVLSGFQPIKVLKNLNNTRLMSKIGMRKALLIVQFSFSLIFILTVIVIYNQLNLFLHSDYGFNPSNKIVFQKGDTPHEALKAELLSQNNINNVALASHIPSAGVVYSEGFKKTLEEENWAEVRYFAVDEDYLDNMEIPLLAGKFFSAEAGESNENTIVINEEAVKTFNFASNAEALGQVIIYQRDSTEKQIIGVVKNYIHEMAVERLEPLALMYNPDEFTLFQVSYSGDFAQASETIEKSWAAVNPGLKVEIRDFEEKMGELYEILFGTLVKVIGFIATLAVIISCLGLLGMATYTIETRKKEISLRKVLGSSNGTLVYILSKGYLSILLIAMLIAVPAAYLLNTMWLENFSLHVSVDPLTITIGVLILLLFGVITIGSQTLQAIFINPVDNLKDE